MTERELIIRLKNGIEVLSSKEHYFDASVIEERGTFCISHAHSDHMPRRVVGNEVVASDITLRCLNAKSKKQVSMASVDEITMLDAGHMSGSRMFHIEVNDRRVLYTGDLCTRDRCGNKGASPIETDILIIESTYGDPRYVFPPSDVIASLIRDEVEDNLSQGISVSLLAYPFGKSQDMIRILRDFHPYVDSSVYNATSLVRTDVDPLECRLWNGNNIDEPFVIICSPWLNRIKQAELMCNRNIKRIAMSGWAIDDNYKRRMGVHEAFPFSDHADFNDLINFVKGCDPELVITHHGSADSLAQEIKSRLGIDARSMRKGQRTLAEF